MSWLLNMRCNICGASASSASRPVAGGPFTVMVIGWRLPDCGSVQQSGKNSEKVRVVVKSPSRYSFLRQHENLCSWTHDTHHEVSGLRARECSRSEVLRAMWSFARASLYLLRK